MTATKKRAARTKRRPRLVGSSKIPHVNSIPKAKQKENPRVGVRMGDHLMMVSFKHPACTPEVIDGVREMYRHRWFSQRALGEMFGISQSLVAKIVRTDPFWRS